MSKSPLSAINSPYSHLMASNVRPKQTSKPTAYVCTPSDSLLSESALWNWLIPLWMPNWCSVLKAALSVLVALSLSAWSADRRWPPVPGADPERSLVAIFLKGLQKCLWAIRRKTKNEIYSSFLKVYRRKKEEEKKCILYLGVYGAYKAWLWSFKDV